MPNPSAAIAASGGPRPPPHLLIFPFPAQGHLIPLLNLSTHLATHFTITVVTTPKNHLLLLPYLSRSIHALILPLTPSSPEHVRHLPAGTPIAALIHSLSSLSPSILQWSLSHPNPPSALLSDFFLGFSLSLAADLRVPHIPFFSSGALVASLLHHLLLSLPPPPSPPSALISISPSLPSLPFPHLPSIFRRHVPGDPHWDFTRQSLLANSRSSAVIFNSFDSLESPYFSHLRASGYASGRILAVGPILPDPAGFCADPRDEELLRWLDSCPARSVVYVCFGSQFRTPKAMEAALAAALEVSGARFVWAAGEGAAVPAGFEERVAGRGKVVRAWAPQRAAIGHRAVAAFVTHCGWNSVLEGMAAGVLLLCWPMEADQFVNARLLVEEAAAAVRVCGGGPDEVPDAGELGRLIGEAVEEGTWPEVRARAAEMARAAATAVGPGGSSFLDMQELVKLLGAKEEETAIASQNLGNFLGASLRQMAVVGVGERNGGCHRCRRRRLPMSENTMMLREIAVVGDCSWQHHSPRRWES